MNIVVDANYTPAEYWTLPKTRKAGRRTKSRHYFDGVMCIHGHSSPRYTSTGGCVACARLSALRQSAAKNEQPVVLDDLTIQRMNRERRETASKKHERFFEGAKACSCGCTQRYVSNGACVECTKRRAAEHTRSRAVAS